MAIYKEVKAGTPKKRLNYDTPTRRDMIAEEVWKKRENKAKTFAYQKLFNLRKMRENEKIEISDNEDNEESHDNSSSRTVIKERNASLYDKPLLPLFDNSLVQDIAYYKSLSSLGNYTVAYYTKRNLSITDHNSLENHPTTQAVDYCLYVLAMTNESSNFKVLRCKVLDAVSTFNITEKMHCELVWN